MDIQTLIIAFTKFINTSLIPLLLAVAFIAFLWNVTRYFIIGGANSEDQEKAKSLAISGILAFVIISSIWGIVNILVNVIGVGTHTQITPDYMKSKGQ